MSAVDRFSVVPPAASQVRGRKLAPIPHNRIQSLPPGSVAVFRMSGYYATDSKWESWESDTAPNFTPPSGHSLLFVNQVSVRVRGS